jgi:ketose-bisphosphate aldolase
MLVHARKIIYPAYRRRQAVVAFNTINAETTLAIARAASALRRPTLFEVSEKTITYLGLNTVVELVRTICDDPSIKASLAIHLDHAHTYEICVAAIKAGFTSVMIDGSALPFSQNVKLTKRVVDYAHKHNVLVQGEVGALKPVVKGARLVAASDLMTDPAQAREFVAKTGVDTLGVAVGTLHGAMKMFHKLPQIDFSRLNSIHQLVKIPLALHGASGVPAKDLKKARSLGVTIVNIDTEIRLSYLTSLRRELKSQEHEYDPRVIFYPVIADIQKTAEQKLKALSTTYGTR